MKVAIEGCCHGELDKIYESIAELEKQNNFKIDLLIICGDFQSVRNFDDLQAMSVPVKYQCLNTFYKYYRGEKLAPVLTVFIGGNHEASNYLQELPYGGWVAPNIYYLGYAGVIQVGDLRIGGISGIYKGHDFNKGHFERPPYNDATKKSVYHVRNLEFFRLKQISRPVDIFLSHDWPRGIYNYGDSEELLKRKPFFRQEMEEGKLGSWPLSELLAHLKPSYWFAAHLHVKFAAHVLHQSTEEPVKTTKFLALDKCLPNRHFLQVLDIGQPTEKQEVKIKLDPEWLAILQCTDHLWNLTPRSQYMPGPGGKDRYDFKVSDETMEEISNLFGNDLTLPENFQPTSPPLENLEDGNIRQGLTVLVNPQTTLLCNMLDITDPNASFLGKTSQELLNDVTVDDNSDDAVEDDSDSDMPSTIDSSLDVSAASMADSFHTANDSSFATTCDSTDLSSLTSTPHKSFTTRNIQDEDEELLSILSAQRNKSLNMSNNSTEDPQASASDPQASADVLQTSAYVLQTSADDIQTSADNLQAVADDSCQTSPKPHLLKSERSSFGMSSLSLDLSISPQGLKKRSSMENPSESSSQSSADASDQSPSMRKLKRRNVSFYSESTE